MVGRMLSLMFRSPWVLLFPLVFWLFGCQDLKEYRGSWAGRIEQSRLVRRGFDICTRADLEVRALGSTTLDASLTLRRHPDAAVCSADLPDEGAVLPLPSETVTLSPVPEILNDALANLQIEGEPLFTHLSWVRLAGQPHLVFLTVYRDDRLELRITGSDAYASFRLGRARD